MKAFKLPVIRKGFSESKYLTMDKYYQFVQFHLKETFSRRSYSKWKKMLSVNVPFYFK